MIAKARERDIYDGLLVADITEPLAAPTAAYDLIIAADVLCMWVYQEEYPIFRIISPFIVLHFSSRSLEKFDLQSVSLLTHIPSALAIPFRSGMLLFKISTFRKALIFS